MTTATATAPPAVVRSRAPSGPPPPPSPGNRATSGATGASYGPPKVKMGVTSFIPPRILITGGAGAGKTSILSNFKEPLILQISGETGYNTLCQAGLVPECLNAEVDSLADFLGLLDYYIAQPDPLPFKTLGIDTLLGIDLMIRNGIVAEYFKGKRGDDGYTSYNKGEKHIVFEWEKIQMRLEKLNRRGVTIVILAHQARGKEIGPDGVEYPIYAPDCHKEFVSQVVKYVDFAFFLEIVPIVVEKNRRAQLVDYSIRRVWMEPDGIRPVKHRYNVFESYVDLPNDPAQSWASISNNIDWTKRQTDAASVAPAA